MHISHLHDITFVTPMPSSNQARGATQCQRAPLAMSAQFVIVSSLRNANNSICFRKLLFYFLKPLLPVDGRVAAIRCCASAVSLSRDAGRLTALMAVKISGKNVDSWESHRQCKGDERESSPLRPLPRKQEGAQLVFIAPHPPAPQMSPVKHRSVEWALANCAWCCVLSLHIFLLVPLAVCL